MQDFAAIDFETANNERSSVCSVGIVIVRNGEIVDSFYSLIQPEPNYYNYWCSQVHGLCQEDTDDAPVFPKVWAQIEPHIEGLPLVAHNKPFDEGCLKAVFRPLRPRNWDSIVPVPRFATSSTRSSTCSHRMASSPSTTTS